MTGPVYISICIPAYKNTAYLQRLLDSIAIQTFPNYEVIITDDSPDYAVQNFINSYAGIVRLNYYRNPVPLGTPENWNESMRKATGKWLKLMHDDDWFSHERSLERFAKSTEEHSDVSFFFSAFQNIDQLTGKTQTIRCNAFDQFMLSVNPLHLFKKVYVGNPSCTLIRRDLNLFYDKQFKWVVDFEYYIRCLRKSKRFHYINEVLLNIGFNIDQVTRFTFRVPEVEVSESYRLIDKLGYRILRNIIVYDYYWRLHRNLSIRNEDDVRKYYPGPIHPILRQMIRFQGNISLSILKVGIISKILMFLNYCAGFLKKA